MTNKNNKRITYIEVLNKNFIKLFIISFYLFAILFFAKDSSAQTCSPNQYPCWTEINIMETPRWGLASAKDEIGNIYIVGGYNGNGTNFYKNFDKFEIQSNSWIPKTYSPVEVVYPGFEFSNVTKKFYMAGGVLTGNIVTNKVFEYDPQTNTWITKNSLPINLNQLSLIEAFNGKIYAVGGGNEIGYCTGAVFEYNPLNDAWISKSNMPTPRCDPAVTIDNQGLIYAIGGNMDRRFNYNQTNIVEVFNPSTNSWSTLNSMNQIRYGLFGNAITTKDGKIIIAGGVSGYFPNNQLASVEEYNPQTGIWTYINPLPVARDYMQMVYSNNKIYIFGGRLTDGPETAAGSVLEGSFPEPTISNINLNVPLIKQTSEPWGSKEYDSASIWNPLDTRIYSWGCAITSAVMVFKYHGLNNLPGNTPLDPGSLNDWLKKQKDGYVGGGLVNWLALSRLSKQLAGINHIKTFHALEFSKTISSDKNKVINNLKNNTPDILGVPGHFIVAKGITDNIITINDPGFTRDSLSKYGNTFVSINNFKPSKTDLSYIMLTIPTYIDIALKDSQGNLIGDTFIESPINNLNGNDQTTGAPIKIILLQKPEAQNYEIILNSDTNTYYEMGLYLYDKNGEVLVSEKTGNLTANQSNSVNFYFDGQSEIYPRKISFGKFGSDLNKVFREFNLNLSLYNQLDTLLNEANQYHKNDQNDLALLKLNEFEKLVSENNQTIDQDSLETLLYDVNYLATHL